VLKTGAFFLSRYMLPDKWALEEDACSEYRASCGWGWIGRCRPRGGSDRIAAFGRRWSSPKRARDSPKRGIVPQRSSDLWRTRRRSIAPERKDMEMNRLRSLMLLLIAVFALNAFAVSAYAAEGEKPLVEEAEEINKEKLEEAKEKNQEGREKTHEKNVEHSEKSRERGKERIERTKEKNEARIEKAEAKEVKDKEKAIAKEKAAQEKAEKRKLHEEEVAKAKEEKQKAKEEREKEKAGEGEPV
jgi:hypothetical protein